MAGKQRVRGVLIDLDGVLYDADRLIAGAVNTVKWLQKRSIPHLFVTNTTSKSRAALAEKLVCFGIPIREADILRLRSLLVNGCALTGRERSPLFVRPSARQDFRLLNLLHSE